MCPLVPHTVLSILLISSPQLLLRILLLYPFYRWGHWDSERLSVCLGRDKVKIWVQVCLDPKQVLWAACFIHYPFIHSKSKGIYRKWLYFIDLLLLSSSGMDVSSTKAGTLFGSTLTPTPRTEHILIFIRNLYACDASLNKLQLRSNVSKNSHHLYSLIPDFTKLKFKRAHVTKHKK